MYDKKEIAMLISHISEVNAHDNILDDDFYMLMSILIDLHRSL